MARERLNFAREGLHMYVKIKKLVREGFCENRFC